MMGWSNMGLKTIKLRPCDNNFPYVNHVYKVWEGNQNMGKQKEGNQKDYH
jgi:hypothetical protein